MLPMKPEVLEKLIRDNNDASMLPPDPPLNPTREVVTLIAVDSTRILAAKNIVASVAEKIVVNEE